MRINDLENYRIRGKDFNSNKPCPKVKEYIYFMEGLDNTINDEFNIDVKSESRKKNIVDLRRIFCKYVKKRHKFITLALIGNYLNRDHATVKHHINQFDAYYSNEKHFKKLADFLFLRFRSIDSESVDDRYYWKLLNIINNSSESVMKEYYDAISMQESFQKRQIVEKYE